MRPSELSAKGREMAGWILVARPNDPAGMMMSELADELDRQIAANIRLDDINRKMIKAGEAEMARERG